MIKINKKTYDKIGDWIFGQFTGAIIGGALAFATVWNKDPLALFVLVLYVGGIPFFILGMGILEELHERKVINVFW